MAAAVNVPSRNALLPSLPSARPTSVRLFVCAQNDPGWPSRRYRVDGKESMVVAAEHVCDLIGVDPQSQELELHEENPHCSVRRRLFCTATITASGPATPRTT